MRRPFGEQFETDPSLQEARWRKQAIEELSWIADRLYMHNINRCQNEEFIEKVYDDESVMKINNSLIPGEKEKPLTMISVLQANLGYLAVTYSDRAILKGKKWIHPARVQRLCKSQSSDN